jgi:hypothetical protein
MTSTSATFDARTVVRAPTEPAGVGAIPPAGSRIMLCTGDRFAARWSNEDEVGLCCEVLRKRGGKHECLILNGAWGLTFNDQGIAKHGDRIATIVYILPKKLKNVARMDDWDRVLAVVEQQLRKAVPKKKPATAQLT